MWGDAALVEQDGTVVAVLGDRRALRNTQQTGHRVVCAAALALSPSLRRGGRDYLRVLGPDADRYSGNYLLLAATMMLAGPGLALVPVHIDDRTFWIELFELVPFGLFWVIQTIEYWNEGVVDRAATVGRRPGRLSTSP